MARVNEEVIDLTGDDDDDVELVNHSLSSSVLKAAAAAPEKKTTVTKPHLISSVENKNPFVLAGSVASPRDKPVSNVSNIIKEVKVSGAITPLSETKTAGTRDMKKELALQEKYVADDDDDDEILRLDPRAAWKAKSDLLKANAASSPAQLARSSTPRESVSAANQRSPGSSKTSIETGNRHNDASPVLNAEFANVLPSSLRADMTQSAGVSHLPSISSSMNEVIHETARTPTKPFPEQTITITSTTLPVIGEHTATLPSESKGMLLKSDPLDTSIVKTETKETGSPVASNSPTSDDLSRKRSAESMLNQSSPKRQVTAQDQREGKPSPIIGQKYDVVTKALTGTQEIEVKAAHIDGADSSSNVTDKVDVEAPANKISTTDPEEAKNLEALLLVRKGATGRKMKTSKVDEDETPEIQESTSPENGPISDEDSAEIGVAEDDDRISVSDSAESDEHSPASSCTDEDAHSLDKYDLQGISLEGAVSFVLNDREPSETLRQMKELLAVFENAGDDGDSVTSHDSICDVCNEPGFLYLCDECPRAFHGQCMDDEPPRADEPFICPECSAAEFIDDEEDGLENVEFVKEKFREVKAARLQLAAEEKIVRKGGRGKRPSAASPSIESSPGEVTTTPMSMDHPAPTVGTAPIQVPQDSSEGLNTQALKTVVRARDVEFERITREIEEQGKFVSKPLSQAEREQREQYVLREQEEEKLSKENRRKGRRTTKVQPRQSASPTVETDNGQADVGNEQDTMVKPDTGKDQDPVANVPAADDTLSADNKSNVVDQDDERNKTLGRLLVSNMLNLGIGIS